MNHFPAGRIVWGETKYKEETSCSATMALVATTAAGLSSYLSSFSAAAAAEGKTSTPLTACGATAATKGKVRSALNGKGGLLQKSPEQTNGAWQVAKPRLFVIVISF